MTFVFANGNRDTDERDHDPPEAPDTPPDEPKPPDIEDPPPPEGERGPYVVGRFTGFRAPGAENPGRGIDGRASRH
jgi:hypothetical protein